MKSIVKSLVAVALAIALSSCYAKAKMINEHGAYKAYLATQREMDSNWANAVKSIADSTDKCENDICRVARGGQAMAALMARPGGANAGVQPFRHEPSTGEKVLLALTGQAGTLFGTAVNGYVAAKQSDNQTAAAINDSDNRAAISLGGFGALAQVGTAAANRTTYSVGGNFGDTYGNDFTGGDRSENNVGPGGVVGNGNNTANGENNFNPNQIADNDMRGGNGGNCAGGAAGDGAAGSSGGLGGSGATGTGTGTGGAGGIGGPGGAGGAGGNGGNCDGGAGGYVAPLPQPVAPLAPAPFAKG